MFHMQRSRKTLCFLLRPQYTRIFFSLHKHGRLICFTKSKSWPVPSDLHNTSPVSSLSFYRHCHVVHLGYFDLLSKDQAYSSLLQIWCFYSTFILDISQRPCKNRNVKVYPYPKTVNHFQVHGSSMHRTSPFFKKQHWLCTARGFLVSWFWKWMPLRFGLDPLNNLLCNYILCKSLCVHLGQFGIFCNIAVTTRALTKSKLKPTL